MEQEMYLKKKYNNEVVSVITPVFNAEKYIKQMVESAINQSYPNIEIILVDDCSEDNSAKMIKELQKKYSNIIYHLQPKNMGAGVARNTALELATGRYVAFLDADDIWKTEKIARQIALMKSKKSPMSYTAIEIINENGLLVKEKRNVKEEINYNFLLHNTMIATSTVVIDRKKMGDFRMSLRRGGQDYATWLKLLRNGAVAVGINEALGQYRITPGSLSSNKLKSIRQVWEIQAQDEKIGKIAVVWHIICFSFNGIKKYLF